MKHVLTWSRGRSFIPVPSSTYNRAAIASPPKEINASREIAKQRYVYTDEDVRECPPEGDCAPIIPVPDENAPNSVVKEYLFAVLTRTGWGIAIESNREVRATINRFVGNGWALRNRYQKKDLKDICPNYMSVRRDDGILLTLKISASTRSNIGNCVMHEMERYFQRQNGTNYSERYRGHHEEEPASQSTGVDSSSRSSCDENSETGRFYLVRRPQSRATLPDEWLTERIRTQQASRLSQNQAETAALHIRKGRSASKAVFIERTSAYPMFMDITTLPQKQQMIESGDPEQLVGRKGGNRLCSVRPSTSTGTYCTGTYCTRPCQPISESSLKRSMSAPEMKSLGRVTSNPQNDIQHKFPVRENEDVAGLDVEPTTWIPHDPPQIGPSTATHPPADLMESATLTEHDAVRPSSHTNNDTDTSATSLATSLYDLEKDDLTAEGFLTQLSSPAQTAPDAAKSTQDGAGAPATEQNTLPTQPSLSAYFAAKEWRSDSFNLSTAAPMAAISSSVARPDQRGSEDPDAITAAPSRVHEGSGVVYEGNLITVNDIPVGRETSQVGIPPTAEEVQNARENTAEATARRQQLALAKDRKLRRKRYFFQRLWRSVRSKIRGTASGGQ